MPWFHAVCSQNNGPGHQTGQGWQGPDRTTQKAAQGDADTHNRDGGSSHNASVIQTSMPSTPPSTPSTPPTSG